MYSEAGALPPSADSTASKRASQPQPPPLSSLNMASSSMTPSTSMPTLLAPHPSEVKRKRRLSRDSRPTSSGSLAPPFAQHRRGGSSDGDAAAFASDALRLPTFEEDTDDQGRLSPETATRPRSSSYVARSGSHRSRSLRLALPTHISASSPESPSRSSSSNRDSAPVLLTTDAREDDWLSPRARRWSSSISHMRSAALLTQAASPYLRAGLEELRSIFDVDSNPLPGTFDSGEPSGSEDEGAGLSTPRKSYAFRRRGSGTSDISLLPTAEYPRGSSGPSLAGDRASPPTSVRRGLSPNTSPKLGASLRLARHEHDSPSNDGSPKPVSARLAEEVALDMSAADEKKSLSRKSSLKAKEEAKSKERNVALGLAVTATGITGACMWGFNAYSDIFSPSLLIFFLCQPAFSLLGLASLCLQRRMLMDLFSRAMRAHVLAQSLIALLAFLDLSASASYVRRGALGGAHTWVMSIVPSMSQRFGPEKATLDAGSAPGASLLAYANSHVGQAQVHAHDSDVGSLASRMTHLVVFSVQAAAPLLLALWAQYVVARHLGLLARKGLRRSSSLRSSNTSEAAVTASKRAQLAPLDVADLSARLQRLDNAAGAKRFATAPRSGGRQSQIKASLADAFIVPQRGLSPARGAPNPTVPLSSGPSSPLSRNGSKRHTSRGHHRSLSQPAFMESQDVSTGLPLPASPLRDSRPLWDLPTSPLGGR